METAVSPYVRPGLAIATQEIIDKVVCEYYNVTLDQLKRKCRKREFVEPRQMIYYFQKQVLRHPPSLHSAGLKFMQDHATVLHSSKTISNLQETNKEFAEKVTELRRRIKYETAMSGRSKGI